MPTVVPPSVPASPGGGRKKFTTLNLAQLTGGSTGSGTNNKDTATPFSPTMTSCLPPPSSPSPQPAAALKDIFTDSRASMSPPSGARPGFATLQVGTAASSGYQGKVPALLFGRKAEEGPWSVSVAEVTTDDMSQQQQQPPQQRKPRRKNKSSSTTTTTPQAFTLYITTPTHNLTLQRTASDFIELDQKVKETQAAPAAAALPNLPHLGAAPSVAATTGGRRILQTISRTLSPGGTKSKASSLTQLTSSSTPTPTPTAEGSSTCPTAKGLSPSLEAGPPASVSQANVNVNTDSSEGKTTTLVAAYLTRLANVPSVRSSKAWKRFIRVRTEDLQSVRVERRVHRVRSDLAQHVRSPVAPTNTNVGGGNSHSDIGEDGTRTEDERDGASISGRSESRQSDVNVAGPGSQKGSLRPTASSRRSSLGDRSEAMNRTGSADPSADANLAGRKGNLNFENIPEEAEKEKEAVTAAATTSAVTEGKSQQGSDPAEKEARRVDRPEKRRNRRREPEKVTVDDFEMIRVLGKGCAGKVLLVRHKPTTGLFAMKSIHKRHVLAHQELQHTLTEQAVLKKMARDAVDPFVVKLWWSFHDKNNLYLVMDFHPGGDLATQLSRWGRLGKDRARFYAAEIVEGVEGLHAAGVIYRDLKPENVLISGDGHIVLSDFGLSKEFPDSHDVNSSADPASSRRSRRFSGEARDTTTTFCGTAEYLAPEVIQGLPYSYEVDWWSFGTMLYEMLTGITPFWAETHADMYVRVLHDELVFPDDRALDQDTKSILRGLLQRSPVLRIKQPRIKKHPYFSMIEWAHVFHKRYIPPYIPPIDPLNETDTQNFDEAFLDMQPVVQGEGDDEEPREDGDGSENKKKASAADTTKGDDGPAASAPDATADATKADSSEVAKVVAADGKSLFDGYSFRGRKDSGSIRSSTRSESMASIDVLANTSGETTTAAADTSTDHGPAVTQQQEEPEQLETKTSPTVSIGGATMLDPVQDESDDEDEEMAARAAIMALDVLEREASIDVDASPSNESRAATMTPLTSYAPSQDGKSSVQSQDDPVAPISGLQPAGSPGRGQNAKIRVVTPSSGRPQDTILETDDEDDGEREDEDEEWDIVEPGPTASSDINGGKGQNLFARGVVDTYRMLRRQESARQGSMGPSSVAGGGSGTLASSRPFSRLGRQRKELHRPSKGDLTSGSAASLESSSAPASSGVALRQFSSGPRSDGLPRSQSKERGNKDSSSVPIDGLLAPPQESGQSGTGSPETTSAESNRGSTSNSDDKQQDGDGTKGTIHNNKTNDNLMNTTPSATPNGQKSNDTTTTNGGTMDRRQSRIKRRFTTFFEQAAR